jgi:DNA-binding MarR family transcriptional regulator
MGLHSLLEEAPVRKRSCIVDALELFWELGPDLSLADLLVFLEVAERPASTRSDLTSRLQLTRPIASRALRTLLPDDFPEAIRPAVGLVEVRTSARDRRTRMAWLTPAGRDLVERLNAIVQAGHTLKPSSRADEMACRVEGYVDPALDRIFLALSDSTRRAILARLEADRALSASALAEQLPIDLSTVLEHLDVLSDAGLIRRSKQGGTETVELATDPIRAASEWLAATLDPFSEIADQRPTSRAFCK